MRTLAIASFVLFILRAGTAQAHLELLDPPQRTSRRAIKIGPCGLEGSTRGDLVTVFAPGETVEIRFDEYLDHPGHFRVAFDDDGQDFEPPVCLTNCDDNRQPDPTWAPDTTGLVLLDLIEDRRGGGEYRLEVTLPEITCERCTLQVIQVMYDKRPYTPDGDDVYYTCADLALRVGGADAGAADAGRADAGAADAGRADAGVADAGESSDAGSGPTTVSSGGGCDASGAAGGALWMLSLVVLRRRAES